MPQYFFDIINGHRLSDPSGVSCKDDEQARVQASAIAKQIAIEVPASVMHRRVSILDINGRHVATIEVGEE